MTSTLEELKTALYKDFDKVRATAEYHETSPPNPAAATAYRQAEAAIAHEIIELERKPSQKSPKASP